MMRVQRERIKLRREQMRIWNFKERANLMWQVMGMPKKFLLALAFSVILLRLGITKIYLLAER
jgi:hypothetical protein